MNSVLSTGFNGSWLVNSVSRTCNRSLRFRLGAADVTPEVGEIAEVAMGSSVSVNHSASKQQRRRHLSPGCMSLIECLPVEGQARQGTAVSSQLPSGLKAAINRVVCRKGRVTHHDAYRPSLKKDAD